MGRYNRDISQPNEKLPITEIKESPYLSAVYDLNGPASPPNFALQPTSNLVEYLIQDVSLYQQIKTDITNDKYQCSQAIKGKALHILDNTILCLANRIHFAIKNPEKTEFIPNGKNSANVINNIAEITFPVAEEILVQQLKQQKSSLNTDEIVNTLKQISTEQLQHNKYDIKAFNSVEEKFQGHPPMLLEHRKSDLQMALTTSITVPIFEPEAPSQCFKAALANTLTKNNAQTISSSLFTKKAAKNIDQTNIQNNQDSHKQLQSQNFDNNNNQHLEAKLKQLCDKERESMASTDKIKLEHQSLETIQANLKKILQDCKQEKQKLTDNTLQEQRLQTVDTKQQQAQHNYPKPSEMQQLLSKQQQESATIQAQQNSVNNKIIRYKNQQQI